MPRNRIYLWISGIALLMLLLVAFQLLWMRQAAAAEKRETKLHALKALERTEEVLKNTNYCMVTYSKLYLNPHEGFFMLHTVGDKVDTLHMFTNDEVFAHSDTMLYDFSAVTTSKYPISIDLQTRMRLEYSDTDKFYQERAAFYSNTKSKSVSEKFAAARSIDSLFDMELADSLIGAFLKAERVPGDFGFAFIDRNHNNAVYAKRVKDTAALLRSEYALNIFTDNKFLKPHRLALVFNDGKSVFKMNYELLCSMAIILLLAGAFFAFVKLYLGQVKLNQMKTDFINNLTHEFNTPIANISLAIETLENEQGVQNNKAGKILGIISVESARLRDNIDRALQVTALDKGHIQLVKEETDIVALINTILSTYKMQCGQLGGKIEFIHPEQVIAVVDETHFLNCVCNLIENAVKYRKDVPAITITLKNSLGGFQFIISDQGIGMDRETQSHIFEKFYRAHEGDVHNTKGFGLGLSYVKGIVEAHKGSISVKSSPGAGATFTIQIPR